MSETGKGADDAPLPDPGLCSAPRKRNKKTWEPKPPEQWLRTSPMGRQEIIDEVVGLPDHYIQDPDRKRIDGTPTKHAGKRIPVPAASVKAVLRCIAGWDAPGSEFYRSNENIAHCTGWSVSAVNKANLAMKQVGLLVKERRGWDDTSYSILNWDWIELHRRRYVPPKKGIEERLPTPSDDPGQEGHAEAEPKQVAARPDNLQPLTGEVLDRFAAAAIFNEQELARLGAQDIDEVVRQLLKEHKEETIRAAFSSRDNRQLGSIIHARNPFGYLRKVVVTAIEEGVEGPAAEDEPANIEQVRAEWAAERFAQDYYADEDSHPSEHLQRIFPWALTGDPTNINLGYIIKYVFEQDGSYFRGLPIEHSARTFVKQLKKWRADYNTAFPDGPEEEEPDEEEEGAEEEEEED